MTKTYMKEVGISSSESLVNKRERDASYDIPSLSLVPPSLIAIVVPITNVFCTTVTEALTIYTRA